MNTYDLFESIDIIIDARLKELQLDKTLICQIVDNSERNSGKYVVTYETSKFTANSSDFFLENGDLVYVGVPANNYANAYVISKKITTDTAAKVLDPFYNYAQFVCYSRNSYKINYLSDDNNQDKTTLIHHWDVNDYVTYDNLGLSVTYNSQTSSPFYIILELISNNLIGNDNSDAYEAEAAKVLANTNLALDEQQEQLRLLQQQYGQQTYLKAEKYVLNPSDIASNGFNFPADFTQKKLFDIHGMSQIIGINLYIQLKEPLQSEQEFISLKNIEISFGYLTTKYSKEELSIYTIDGDTYNSNQSKTIYLKWIYLNEEDQVEIYTYRNANKIPYGTSIIWEKQLNGQWITIEPTDNPFVLTVQLDYFKTGEQFRCRILHDSLDSAAKIERISNIFSVKNINQNSANLIIDNSLTLTADESDFSKYYQTDGTIVDIGLANKIQTLSFSAKAIAGIADIDFKDTNINFVLQWKFPNTSTALKFHSVQNDAGQKTEEGQSIIITETYKPEEILNFPNLEIKSNLLFTLEDRYLYSAQANNKVEAIMQVVKNGEILQQDSVSHNFIIQRQGICQNDYVLSFEMHNTLGDRVLFIKAQETVIITPKLYDSYGNNIIFDKQLVFSWYHCSKSGWLTMINSENNTKSVEGFQCSIRASELDDEVSGGTDYCYILKAEYNIPRDASGTTVKQVIGYLPIAINLKPQVVDQLSGPKTIIYDSTGGNPKYYNGSYNLYKKTSKAYELVHNIEYDIRANGISYMGNKAQYNSLYPIITFDQQKKNCWLSPKSTYIREADKGLVVIAYQNETPLWIQSILIYQSNSFSSFVNEWDGSFSLDQKNNTAMMARLGAGSVNQDGSFSGVLLGDWKEKIEENSWETYTGLYGYDHNIASFGFREDGTAFLGQAGSGRINFNGNQGLIHSANFDGSIWQVEKVGYVFRHYNDSFLPFDSTKVYPTDITENGFVTRGIYVGNTTDTVGVWLNITQSDFLNKIHKKKVLFTMDLSVDVTLAIADQKNGNVYFNYMTYQYKSEDKYSFKNLDATETRAVNPKGQYKIQLVLNLSDIDDTIQSLRIPVGAFIGYDYNMNYSARNITITGTNLCFYIIHDQNTDINKFKSVENTQLYTYSDGTQGTYLNLKDGQLIINDGTFRGTLIANDLIVNKEITLGNYETGEYITLGPDGVSLGVTVVKNAGGTIGGGSNYPKDIVASSLTFATEIECYDGAYFGECFANKLKQFFEYQGVTSDNGEFDNLTVNSYFTLTDQSAKSLRDNLGIDKDNFSAKQFVLLTKDVYEEKGCTIALSSQNKDIIEFKDSNETTSLSLVMGSDYGVGIILNNKNNGVSSGLYLTQFNGFSSLGVDSCYFGLGNGYFRYNSSNGDTFVYFNDEKIARASDVDHLADQIKQLEEKITGTAQ